MKASRQCPKCQSKEIRFETLQLGVLDSSVPEPAPPPAFALKVWRLYDSYICAACGFSELYRRP